MIDKTCVKLTEFTLRICKDVNFSSRQMLRCLIRWWAVVHRALTPEKKVKSMRVQDKMKGCIKFIFMPALFNDTSHNDGGVTAGFHHYE